MRIIQPMSDYIDLKFDGVWLIVTILAALVLPWHFQIHNFDFLTSLNR